MHRRILLPIAVVALGIVGLVAQQKCAEPTDNEELLTEQAYTPPIDSLKP